MQEELCQVGIITQDGTVSEIELVNRATLFIYLFIYLFIVIYLDWVCRL